MKSRDLASLAFKIIGWIVIIFEFLPSLIRATSFFIFTKYTYETDSFIVFYMIINIVIPLGIGLGFILANGKIARLIYKKNDDIEISCTAHEIRAIAFACIGLWMICSALSGFIINIISSCYTPAEFQHLYWGWKSIGSLIRFIIGSVLFLQRRGLSNLWEMLNKSRSLAHKD
jgi:hypothetical protein